MTAKLSVGCSCGGNLIILSDLRPHERIGFYECVQLFFHEGERECKENSICEYLYETKQHDQYFDVIQHYVISKQNKPKKEKVKQ